MTSPATTVQQKPPAATIKTPASAPVATQVGPSEARTRGQDVAAGLGRLLADTHTLYLKTHGFHWNVVGPEFPALHELFDREYNDLWRALDPIAERIRALGTPAPASCREFQELTSIEEALDVPTARTMVQMLAADNEAVAKTARDVVHAAEAADDPVSAELATERASAHEEAAWMLRSTLG